MSILEKFYSDAFQDGFDYASERLYAAPAGFLSSQLRKAGPADVAKWKSAAASGDWRKTSKLIPTGKWVARSEAFKQAKADLMKRPRPEMMQPSMALKKTPMARPSLPTAEELRARKGQQILDNMRSTRGMAD